MLLAPRQASRHEAAQVEERGHLWVWREALKFRRGWAGVGEGLCVISRCKDGAMSAQDASPLGLVANPLLFMAMWAVGEGPRPKRGGLGGKARLRTGYVAQLR
ncbi:hypothetical protein NDU88_006663 [Pleurodeles waltl]|uniref:Uncharacterized protein n=1 Tax=Pleurodeles waltl TaxID=8319 RepID=A0AAV7N130_PLEWA|nr:hypothetical protein NDU88_006663 [Pleurodeles waltl]